MSMDTYGMLIGNVSCVDEPCVMKKTKADQKIIWKKNCNANVKRC